MFQVQASDKTILIYGDIGESWWGDESVTAKKLIAQIQEMDTDLITVRINSYGGSVTDGIAIFNALKRHPALVQVHIDGVAVSIASLIAMAGDEIIMAENAQMMIHAPWTQASGNAIALREQAELLEKFADSMRSAYASRIGEDTAKMFLTDGKDHWFDSQEALKIGLIDSISQPLAIAAGVPDRYLPSAKKQEPTMTTEIDMNKVRAEALNAEKARRGEIREVFGAFAQQNHELLNECLDDPSVTVDLARAKLLKKLGETHQPLASDPIMPRVDLVHDERDKFRSAAAQSILARAGVDRADGSNPYRGYKLLDLARTSLDFAGVNTKGIGQMEIVAAAITQSTSDFPILLEDALHKSLQSGYAVAPDTWSRFCAIGSVSDFRAHTRYRVGSLGNLDSLTEGGEYKNKALSDGEKSSITASTKGNIVSITREAIINDDLGALVGVAGQLGRAAARTVEAAVYSLLGQNSGLGPTLSDGSTLFHANHGNIGTAGALSVSTIENARTLLASQLDVSANDYLDLRPSVLLVPISSGGTARVINSAEYDPDTANKLQKPNMVRGLFRDVVDTPRLSGTRFYVFADPMDAPVIEVAFLDGQRAPYGEVQTGWRVDGTEWKVRLDFGVAAIDYRGAVTNAGA